MCMPFTHRMQLVLEESQRRSALDTFLGAELMQVPTVDELKAELDDLRAGGFA